MIELAITLGSVMSLVAYDVFGLAAGGIVVPGYIALHLHHPERLLGLLVIALLTWGSVRFLSRHMFLFGRRKLVMCVLLGCLLAGVSRRLGADPAATLTGLEAIGWVIPGLIAYWCSRQGTLRTLCVLAITATFIRLSLILIAGGESLAI